MSEHWIEQQWQDACEEESQSLWEHYCKYLEKHGVKIPLRLLNTVDIGK